MNQIKPQQPIAVCLVERKQGVGYDVTKWLVQNSRLTNQHALDIIGEIEEGIPSINSSLICRSIGRKKYLIVGTVWTPPAANDSAANDCFLVKWYDEAAIAKKRTAWRFILLFLLVGLVLGFAAARSFTGKESTAVQTQECKMLKEENSKLSRQIESFKADLLQLRQLLDRMGEKLSP